MGGTQYSDTGILSLKVVWAQLLLRQLSQIFVWGTCIHSSTHYVVQVHVWSMAHVWVSPSLAHTKYDAGTLFKPLLFVARHPPHPLYFTCLPAFNCLQFDCGVWAAGLFACLLR